MKNRQNLIEKIMIWQLQKEQAIPESSYYYYCFGVEMGLKLALNMLDK